jgi:cephalosporin hydroxylase
MLLSRLLGSVMGSHRRAPSGGLAEYFHAHNQRRGDLEKFEHYIPIYERHLAALRGKPVTVLEIGVRLGGSLRMWRHYFGDQARIFGLDIDPECRKFEAEGFRVFIGDQADSTFLAACLVEMGRPDIVIDDGGHRSVQQIASFETLYPAVSENGTYLVEDTHTNYWEVAYGMPESQTFMQFAKNRIDELNAWHWNPGFYERYATPRDERSGTVEVPAFTRSTHAVAFYDSIVVFEKRRTGEPRHWTGKPDLQVKPGAEP